MGVTDKSGPHIRTALAAVRMCRIYPSGPAVQPDVLAVEDPLEIRLGCDVGGRRVPRAVSITMRTPGIPALAAAGAPSSLAASLAGENTGAERIRQAATAATPAPSPRCESRCPWSKPSSPPGAVLALR